MRVLTLTKKELAQLCGVTGRTINIWLNVRYFSDLEKLGYYKTQRILLPKQVNYICGILDIQENELIDLKKQVYGKTVNP